MEKVVVESVIEETKEALVLGDAKVLVRLLETVRLNYLSWAAETETVDHNNEEKVLDH